MAHWKKTKVLASLIDEVKSEYIKVIKQLQVDGIIKPIANPNLQLPTKTLDKSLTTAYVFC